MRFTVSSADLQRDSRAVHAAAHELARVDVGKELEPLAVGFPGGVTAVMVREMGQRWADRVLAVRLGTTSLADGLVGAAASYEELDSVVRRAFDAGGSGRHA